MNTYLAPIWGGGAGSVGAEAGELVEDGEVGFVAGVGEGAAGDGGGDCAVGFLAMLAVRKSAAGADVKYIGECIPDSLPAQMRQPVILNAREIDNKLQTPGVRSRICN